MTFLLIFVFLAVLMIFLGVNPMGSLLFGLVLAGPICAVLVAVFQVNV